MSQSGFKKLNKELFMRYIEGGLDSLRRSYYNNVPEQMLYITEGAIRESILLEKAGKTLLNQGFKASDLTIDVLKKEAPNYKTATVEKQASTIFKALKAEAHGLSLGGRLEVIIDAKTIIIIGTFNDISKASTLLADGLNRNSLAYKYLENSQIGHTIGVGALAAKQILNLNIKVPKDIKQDIDFIMAMEYDSKLDHHIRKITGLNSSITLTLELSINGIRGSATSAASKRVRDWFDANVTLGKYFNRIPNSELTKIVNTKFSTSIEEDLASIIEATFLEKKFRNRKKLRRDIGKDSKKSKRNIKPKPLILGNVVRSRRKRGKAPSLNDNLLDLKNIINANMHEILKSDVMGRGTNPDLLNYRTGRFAQSARVENLVAGQAGGLHADITWQRYPYDTFAPGGRLHKPMRDPSYLIGKSIREIMRDLGLARLNISTKVL